MGHEIGRFKLISLTSVRAGWNVENNRSDALWIGSEGFPGGSVKDFGSNKRQLFLNIWRYPGFQAIGALCCSCSSMQYRPDMC